MRYTARSLLIALCFAAPALTFVVMKASTRAHAHESLRSQHTGKQQLSVVCVSDTHDLHNTPQLKVPQGQLNFSLAPC